MNFWPPLTIADHSLSWPPHWFNGWPPLTAMAVLGHKYGLVTEIYAERDLQKAMEIMREIG
jgi:hypothetical protein